MSAQKGPLRSDRRRGGANAVLLSTVFLLVSACVRWQPIPPAGIVARPLPRWVQLTTRDSVRYLLEDARVVSGDTLIGRPAEGAAVVRLPLAEVTHLEARVPSGLGSIGIGSLVIGGVVAFVALVGHAASW